MNSTSKIYAGISLFSAIISLVIASLIWFELYDRLTSDTNKGIIDISFGFLMLNFTFVIALIYGAKFSMVLPLKKTPTSFKPFIELKYDYDFWKSFKKKEYLDRKKSFFGEAFFLLVVLVVCSGMPFMIFFMNLKEALDLILSLSWFGFVFLVIAIVLMYFKIEVHKKRSLSFPKPIVQMNSNGFVMNGEYTYLCLEKTDDWENTLKLRKKYGVHYFEYVYTERFLDTSLDSPNRYTYVTKKYLIPFMSRQKEEVHSMIQLLNKKRKLNLEYPKI